MSEWGKRGPGPGKLPSWIQPARAPGSRLGRFEILGQLGAGGMGVVYAAHDPDRDRTVALKTLWGGGASGGGSLYAFKREFRALADIAHPNLVQLYELENEGDVWFFTMEAVHGADPLAYIRTGIVEEDPWPALGHMSGGRRESPLASTGQYARLRETAVQVASGLVALHRIGIVHRDVKPTNILVTPEGRAVLLDFGLIAEVAQESSDTQVVGTAAYMAPEQAAGTEMGPAADWYSFGVFLYEAITGSWPFDGPPIRMLMRKQKEQPASVRERVPDAPSDLARLCRELLRADPADRPNGDVILRFLGGKTPVLGGIEPESDSPPFVGRHNEIGHLEQAFGESRGSRPASVVFKGGPGVGKTALVKRFLERLRGEHKKEVLVLSGRCHEREFVAYKAFDGILDAISQFLKKLDPIEAAMILPDDTPLLARLFPVLRRVPIVARMPGQLSSSTDPCAQRVRAFNALSQLLEQLSKRWQLVLFVDDLQWADADSLAIITQVLAPSNRTGVLFLATLRTDENGDVPWPVAQAVTGLRRVRVLEISSLATEEAIHLTHLLHKRITGQHASARLAQEIADESGGHPLFIDELVRYVGEAGEKSPLRLDDALGTRIKGLDSTARRLLEVVAVGAFPMRLDTASAAAGLESEDWSKSAAVLRVANLARTTGSRANDTIEPYHDRVRDAVLRGMEIDQRAHLHRRIADELQAEGLAVRDPHLVLAHLEASGDRQRAAELALEAATAARDSLAFDRAAALYQMVLAFGAEAEGLLLDVKMELAQALTNAGRTSEAADVYMQIAERAPAGVRLDCQRKAAAQFLQAGHIDRGFSVLAKVLDDANLSIPRCPRAATRSLLWQRAKLRVRGLGWRPTDESNIRPAALRKLDIYTTLATTMAMIDNVRAADFHARAVLLALELGEPRRVVTALGMESMFLGSQGGSARHRAKDIVAEVVRVGEVSDERGLRAWAVAARALEHFFSGRFRLALERLRESMATGYEQNEFYYQSSARLYLLFALRFLGDIRQLKSEFDEQRADAERRGDLYTYHTVSSYGNRLWLCEDEPEKAREELAKHQWMPDSDVFHLQHWFQLRSLVEVDLYEGICRPDRHRDSCNRLQESKLSRVQVVRSEYAWLCGRMALARADRTPEEAARTALEMAKRLGKEHICYAQVWSHLLKAGAESVRGQSHEVIRQLRMALELSEQNDLAFLASMARLRLGEVMGDKDGAPLRRRAEQWFEGQGVLCPDKVARVIAPGF